MKLEEQIEKITKDIEQYKTRVMDTREKLLNGEDTARSQEILEVLLKDIGKMTAFSRELFDTIKKAGEADAKKQSKG